MSSMIDTFDVGGAGCTSETQQSGVSFKGLDRLAGRPHSEQEVEP